MSLSLPVFPGLAPDRSYNLPLLPVRSPKWNFKRTRRFGNEQQQTVNGGMLVTKYWPNPLWQWEWMYGYIKDNPNDLNPFYTVPIPATDFEVLDGFYSGMQGTGNLFAYQPPNSVRGGVFTAATVVVAVANVAVIKTNGAVSLLNLRLGDVLHGAGFSTATYLNGANGTVVAVNYITNTITLSVTTSGTHTLVSDTGTLAGGQPLLFPDANNNSELVQTIGTYPTTISSTPTTTLVTESIQLIDPATIQVYDNGTATGTALLQPNSTPPYPGYVVHFGSTPTGPITASYQYFYNCRFSQDTQEYENFMAMIHLCSSVKFEQVPV